MEEKFNQTVVSSYEPRLCGIGIYSSNWLDGMTRNERTGVCRVAAIDDGKHHRYSAPVDIKINQYDSESWRTAAYKIGDNALRNSDGGKKKTIVSVNHEFGLGGKDWERDDNYNVLLSELRNTEAYKKGLLYVITTFHTILANPGEFHRDVTRKLVKNSDATIVLSQLGKDILTSNKYGLKEEENLIEYIDHGVRMDTFSPDEELEIRRLWGSKDNTKYINITGLISPSKGIFNYAVPGYMQAVKELEKKGFKDPTRLLIQGGSHPEFEAHPSFQNFSEEGTKILYNSGLLLNQDPFNDRRMVRGIDRKTKDEKHGILFAYNPLSDDEYSQGMAGAYGMLFPYPNKQQISSGQIAEALGHGKDSIATKFWHATEMLSSKRPEECLEDILDTNKMPLEGQIIGIGDPNARGLLVDCDKGQRTINQISEATVHLLMDEEAHEIRSKNAGEYGDTIRWDVTGNKNYQIIHKIDERRKRVA